MHGHLCPHTLTPLGPEPFLCFQRRARGDVLCGEHKLMGSAQRRRRGAMLQHGSLLLGKSACAPELPGVQDFTRQVVTRERIEPIFQKNIFEIIMQNLTQIQYQWSRSDLNEIEIIEKEQFLSTSWLLRR
jgi:lipoate-protein ligase A